VRNDRRATALGASLEFRALGTRVIVTRESGSRTDKQNREPFIADSDVERWRAEGDEMRFQMQRTFARTIQATLVGVSEQYDGRGSRSDLDGIAFIGRDTRRGVEADVRATIGADWMGAVTGGIIQMHHSRTDYAAELATDLNSRTPFVSAEIARRVASAWISAGASAAAQVPLASSLPQTDNRGAHYNRLIAPDLAYTLAEARARAWWVNVLVPVRGSAFSVGIRQERTTPHTLAPDRLQPEGERSGWSVAVGVRR